MDDVGKTIQLYTGGASGDGEFIASSVFLGINTDLPGQIGKDRDDLEKALTTTLASTGMPDPQAIADAQAQLEEDPAATNLDITNAATGQQLGDELGLDPNINDYLSSTTFSIYGNDESFYTYQVSLLDGNLNVVLAPGVTGADIEVGAGGTATIVGGAESQLFLWQNKNVIWENNSLGNAINFGPELGSGPAPTQGLVLNLLTGEGINPFGGTLQISGVDTVAGAGTNEYIVANNDGDVINGNILISPNGLSDAGGTAVLIGGTGNDVLDGAFNGDNLIVAGRGTSYVAGSEGYENYYGYNEGSDEIQFFGAADGPSLIGPASVLDLTSLNSITSFSQVMADGTQVGENAVFTFGPDESVTLDSVTLSDLTAANFVFAPIVAFVSAPGGAVTQGEVVPITLTVTDAVTVNTAGGTPALTLNDGGVAVYNAAASDPAELLLVFDYTVGSTDATPDLEITGIDNNGAVISAAGGQTLNFSGAVGTTLGVQVSNPLIVSSVALSATGEVDTGADLNITLQMNAAVNVDLGEPLSGEGVTATVFGLQLGDGSIAYYNGNLSTPSSGELVFNDTVAAADHTANLSITGVLGLTPTLGLYTETTVENAAGYGADFAGALISTGLAINPPVYVGSISTDAAASPTGIGGEVDAGQTFQITLSLNEGVTVNTAGGAPSLMLSDGETLNYDAAASTPAAGALVFQDVVGETDHSPDVSISSLALNGATVETASGQTASFAGAVDASLGVQINPSPLTVTAVTGGVGSEGGDIDYSVTLTMSEPVANAPVGNGNAEALILNNGDLAFYSAESGNQITFTDYESPTAEPPTEDADLTVVGLATSPDSLTGTATTFVDANGYAANFTGAFGIGTGVTIGNPLYVTSLTTNSADGESEGGQPVVITIGMSEAVTIAGGALSLTLNDGGNATYDAAASTLGSGVLAFSYTPPTGEEFSSLGINSVNLNGASVNDASGNAADFSLLIGTPLQLQIGPATVVTAASTAIGNLAPGEATQFILVMSQNVDINIAGGTPTLTLSNGGTATYNAALTAVVASDGPNSVGQIVFDYTAGSATPDLSILHLNLNGAVITDVQSGLNADFSAVSSAFLGVTISCFAQGTLIATALGDVAVEDLAVGGEVRLADGGLQRIVWVGHRRVDCRRHPFPETVWPVQVNVGAFAPGVPGRALYLSPEHAVFCDGILIPIKCLINGTSILQMPCDAVTYWHVELEQHDVLLAEGLACESYLEMGRRSAFEGSVMQIAPEFAPVDCEVIWEAAGCAPLRIAGPQVERTNARLRRRAGLKPAGIKSAPPDPVVVDLLQLLQPQWYLRANPDVAAAGMDATMHYELWGRREGRLPCGEVELTRALGLVDELTAVVTMPDVATAGVEFAEHYCAHGWHEGRRPNVYFKADWYFAQAEVPAGMNPLLHYVLLGEPQGLTPSEHLEPAWYRRRYGLADSVCVLAHYLQHRRTGCYSPTPAFDVFAYTKAHRLRTSREPYAHFLCERQKALGQQAALGNCRAMSKVASAGAPCSARASSSALCLAGCSAINGSDCPSSRPPRSMRAIC